MKLKALPILALMCGVNLHAATPIISSFGDLGPGNDDDSEQFVRGVSYKIQTHAVYTNPISTATQQAVNKTATHTLSAFDNQATQVQLSSLSFQSSKEKGQLTTTALFVSIFSGLTVDANGSVTSLGSLVAASDNSIALKSNKNTQKMTWNFTNVVLNVGSTYQFVFTTTATPTLSSHISVQALETRSGTNLLAETSLIGANALAVSNAANIDPVFEMNMTTRDVTPLPEPSSALLVAGAGMLLLFGARKRA